MRTLLGLIAALLLLPALPAAAAAPETTVGFGLPRGAAPTVPYVAGRTLVDGTVRIPVDADYIRYVGRAGAAYVVVADESRVLRLAADGTTTRLGRTFGSATRLAEAGDRLVSTRIRRNGTSALVLRSAVTGQKLAQRQFQGQVSALDVAGDRVLFGGARRTGVWSSATGDVERVSSSGGYVGDLGEDLVAVLAKPQIEGGCTDVLRVSTGATVWSTCEASVLEFGPAGRMATAGAYLDGPLGLVELRTVAGKRLASYRTDGNVGVGVAGWETAGALLIGLEGPHRTGIARCNGAECELAAATKRPA